MFLLDTVFVNQMVKCLARFWSCWLQLLMLVGLCSRSSSTSAIGFNSVEAERRVSVEPKGGEQCLVYQIGNCC